MIKIPETNNDLLKECRVDTFRASGKGGQHVNKTDSAVRLTHLSTGVVVTCQRSEEHTSELQSRTNLVCRLLLEKKKKKKKTSITSIPLLLSHHSHTAP